MAKKLFRSREKKMIGGVCAGLADYLDLDVTIVRLLFVAIALFTAIIPMFIFYLLALIIIPTEEKTPEAGEARQPDK